MRAPGPGTAALVLVISALWAAGCAAVGGVQPGAGSRTTITGFSVRGDLGSRAACRERAFRGARERPDARHHPRRPLHGFLAGHRIAVFITPTVDAPEYTVEAGAKGKFPSRSPGLPWERQVLQDLSSHSTTPASRSLRTRCRGAATGGAADPPGGPAEGRALGARRVATAKADMGDGHGSVLVRRNEAVRLLSEFLRAWLPVREVH
jgi:hypothetical protein